MTDSSFTAIDFETATSNPNSICQIGLIRVEYGEVTFQYDHLIRPPNNFYFYKNIEIHGIKPVDTENAPSFDKVWWEIKKHIENEIVVAHNAQFDVNCLRYTLAYYDEIQPNFEVQCTRKIYKRGLSYLAKKYRIPLNHHDALSDAQACAQLYIKHLAHMQLPRTGELFPGLS